MTHYKFDTNLHKQVLTNLLIDIAKILNGKVGFKGGTAAMLFCKLPRLSLDLDFDILKPLNEKDQAELKNIFQKQGTVKTHSDKRFTLFYLLDYQANTPNIKIEFNKRIWQNNAYQHAWLLGVPITVADETTMLTNKLIALTNRRSAVARDLFDSYYFLKMNYQLNEKLVSERTGESGREYIARLIGFIKKNYTAKNVLHGIGELLDEQQKQWAKTHLIKETIFELEKLLTSF